MRRARCREGDEAIAFYSALRLRAVEGGRLDGRAGALPTVVAPLGPDLERRRVVLAD